MRLGKILSFLVLTVSGGLLQLWVLALMMYAHHEEIYLGSLLGDGGLFFFSTSLVCTSFLLLANQREMILGSADFNVTIILGGSLTLTSVVYYSSVLSGTVGRVTAPFSSHLGVMICCAIIAVVYAFYVAVVTKFFRSQQ